MVLNRYRVASDKLLRPFAVKLKDIPPNEFSKLALGFAILAALTFWFANFLKPALLLGSGFVLLNAFFDALDGKVAELTRSNTKRGDFLDHVLDRYADIFILCGIIFTPYCNITIGLFAVIAILLTSYMGTQAQALGLKRLYAGALGRADRLLILIIVPIVQFIYPQKLWQFFILEWMMIFFAIFGNLTAIQRAYSIWKRLGSKKK
jgi:phosphatidylglycerophosphate synthase